MPRLTANFVKVVEGRTGQLRITIPRKLALSSGVTRGDVLEWRVSHSFESAFEVRPVRRRAVLI